MPKATMNLNSIVSKSTPIGRRWTGVLMVMGFLLVSGFCVNGPALFAAPSKTIVEPGNAELAERFYDLARMTLLQTRTPVPPQFSMAGDLLEAATRLNPTEPRFPRMWADAMVQARDQNSAIRALTAYVNLVPDDKSALSQLCDLRAAAIETVDQRLDYLNGWVDDKRLPEEVRSHIAILAALCYNERSQITLSKKMQDKALKLNPLNMDALRMQLEYVTARGAPRDRVATLLQMLQSNPNQVQYISRLAQDLSVIGLAQESLLFYGVGFNLATRQNIAVPREFALGYAVELLLFNQPAATKQLIDSLLLANPSDYDTLALRLVLERLTGQKDATEKTMSTMRNVLLNRLQVSRKSLGDSKATTRPVETLAAVDWGTFDDDVKSLLESKNENAADIKGSYTETLAEIAWFVIYFDDKTSDAKPMVDVLAKLLPVESPLMARLEGWNLFRKGEKDQAKIKLTAVKDVDAIANLGLILMLDSKEEIKTEGTKLLSRNPAGLNAVTLLDSLRNYDVGLVANDQLVKPVRDVLKNFNGTWMSILEAPGSFYTLRCEPMRISHGFGEPMLMKVTIENKSEFPITIGPEGVIRQDLWFDAEFRGIVSQNMMGAAYDRIDREIVLKPHASTSKVVRVDQGSLSQLMVSSPFPALQVTFRVRTNPSTSGNGLAPAGQIVQSKSIERSGFGFSPSQMVKLSQSLQSSTPEDKIAKTDLAASIALILSQQQNNDDARKTSAQLVELLKASRNDPSSPVAVWALGTLARISSPNDRPTACKDLLNNQTNWTARLLGLAFLGPIRLEDQVSVVKQIIEFEKDPTVLAYAKSLQKFLAMVEEAQLAGQSTTQPSTQPIPSIAGIPNPDTTPVITVPGTKPVLPTTMQVKTDATGMPIDPTKPPTIKSTGPEMFIPNLPVVLPDSAQPTTKPSTQPTTTPTTMPTTQPTLPSPADPEKPAETPVPEKPAAGN